MPKPNPLTQGLEQRAPANVVVPSTAQPTRAARPAVVPSRSGRVLVGGHFAPEVQTALKIIAAEERSTVQALLAEAINMIFAKRRKPEIADFSVNS